jgi:hypothetical protein
MRAKTKYQLSPGAAKIVAWDFNTYTQTINRQTLGLYIIDEEIKPY